MYSYIWIRGLLFQQFWRDNQRCDLRAYLDQREFYSRACMEEFLNLDGAYDFCMIWTRRVLDDATSSIVVGRVQYHMDHLLVTSVIY